MFNVSEESAMEFLNCAWDRFGEATFNGMGFLLGSFQHTLKQNPTENVDPGCLSWLCLNGYLTTGNSKNGSLPEEYRITPKGIRRITNDKVSVAV